MKGCVSVWSVLLVQLTFSSIGGPVPVVWVWPSRVPLKPKCPARTTRTAAAVSSTFPSLLGTMMSTSLLEVFPSQVSISTSTSTLSGFNRLPLTCLLLIASPFRVPVRDLVDPSKVRCSGPGLGSGVRAGVSQTFTVDCSRAGVASLEVQLYGPTGKDFT